MARVLTGRFQRRGRQRLGGGFHGKVADYCEYDLKDGEATIEFQIQPQATDKALRKLGKMRIRIRDSVGRCCAFFLSFNRSGCHLQDARLVARVVRDQPVCPPLSWV